jgi:LuxR family maltose regulon positive regulatory protein
LERENLFIVPLDTQGQWYRYHHLFADLLQSRVEQLPPEEIRRMHHKASLWYDSHQQTYEAIGHALDAHEYDMAVNLMVKASPALVMRSEVTTLFKWLNSLPQAMRGANPRIPLMYAWAHFFMTDINSVETHISDAFHALQLEDRGAENWPESFSSETGEMLAQINALRTFVAVNRDEPQNGIRIANYALAHLPKDEKLGRFSVLAALGDAYRDADNFAAASQAYAEALAVSEVIDQYAASLTMRMDLARLRVKMGQLRHAKVNCNEVLAGSEERYHLLFPVAQAYSLLGDLLREQNELEQAEQVLTTSIQQCEWAGYLRYLVFSQVSAARVKFALGEAQAMERFLEAANQSASMSGSEPLRAWVSQFRVRLLKNEETAWLAEHKLSLEDKALFPREDEYLTLARLHLDRARRSRLSDPQAVLQLLERLLVSAQKSARIGSAIEILMLQALALKLLGKNNDAIQKCRQSLVLAEPEGYIRMFVDEGPPMAELLLLAIQNNIHPEYANRLFHLIEAREKRLAAPGNLSEPLTVREGEVLRLLAAGLSNQEIAERLVISLSTIKTHITRIYGKLDVNSRTQAIAKGRELNLF